ncbi:hypothetical protein [Oceanirhabdus seepicola]|uniref:Transposase n=1 Tax=Oceanirhabdus seepicola TaxID=2828781 RepID=A0A9J6P1E6_9CLOT|nr:hypothetical protein [Oceanirhabdus seepicola]MCM1989272.1 transposase [Oceanirhabdus seepicola]
MLKFLELKDTFVTIDAMGCQKSIAKNIEDKESVEHRYYIASINCNVEHFAKGVRKHWGIENKVHWVLDVSFSCKLGSHTSYSNEFI